MAYTWTPNPKFMEHCGISIFHIFKDDDASCGVRSHWYAVTDQGSDCDSQEGGKFDIRDLPSYGDGKLSHEEILKQAIENGELDEILSDAGVEPYAYSDGHTPPEELLSTIVAAMLRAQIADVGEPVFPYFLSFGFTVENLLQYNIDVAPSCLVDGEWLVVGDKKLHFSVVKRWMQEKVDEDGPSVYSGIAQLVDEMSDSTAEEIVSYAAMTNELFPVT